MPKPLKTQEVVQACQRAMDAVRSASINQGATCYAFIGAAGGVGTTVLAIETAFLLARRSKQPERTCLIDLDFQSGMVAQYLNLSPNLQLEEMSSPDRLDRQLLDVLLSRHDSGLAVLAAPNVLTAFARRFVHPGFRARGPASRRESHRIGPRSDRHSAGRSRSASRPTTSRDRSACPARIRATSRDRRAPADTPSVRH